MPALETIDGPLLVDANITLDDPRTELEIEFAEEKLPGWSWVLRKTDEGVTIDGYIMLPDKKTLATVIRRGDNVAVVEPIRPPAATVQ